LKQPILLLDDLQFSSGEKQAFPAEENISFLAQKWGTREMLRVKVFTKFFPQAGWRDQNEGGPMTESKARPHPDSLVRETGRGL
jgi:hypothetical protein